MGWVAGITLMVTLITILFGEEPIVIMDGVEKTIKRCIDDDEKEEKALAIMKVGRAELEESQINATLAMLDYHDVNTNYHATVQDFEAATTALEAAWNETEVLILDQGFQLKEIFSDEEWAECIKVQDKKMDKRMKRENKKQAKSVKKQSKKVDKHNEKYGDSDSDSTPETK